MLHVSFFLIPTGGIVRERLGRGWDVIGLWTGWFVIDFRSRGAALVTRGRHTAEETASTQSQGVWVRIEVKARALYRK